MYGEKPTNTTELLPPEINTRVRELPPDFHEHRDRDTPPWEPTPGDRSLVPNHQREVEAQLEQLVTVYAPEELPDEAKWLAYSDYYAGNARRETENKGSYGEWLTSTDSELLSDPGLLEIEQKIGYGTACPDELLHFMQHTSLKSIELAKLFHPYGYRMQYVPEMRQRIDEGIKDCGGYLLEESSEEEGMDKYRNIDFMKVVVPMNQKFVGYLVKYKRDIGGVIHKNGHPIRIVERQLAGLRLDRYSDLPFDIYKKVSQRTSMVHAVENWEGRMLEETGLKEFVEADIQSDTAADYLIPLSTTVFAYNTQLTGSAHPKES